MWAQHYLPRLFSSPSAEFHREALALCEKHDSVALAAPRGHAKSTVITLLYALYAAATQRARYIVILSDTTPQAGERIGDIITQLLENEELTKAYPHLALPDAKMYRQKRVKRAASELITSGGVVFRAAGSGQSIRGARKDEARPDLIICDDLENEENTESATQRAKLYNWFQKTVMALPGADGGKIIVVGTIIHPDSLLARLVKRSKGWVTRVWAAIVDDAPLWPEHWTMARLLELKERLTPSAWASEYMNDPLDGKRQLFKRHVFYYDELPPSHVPYVEGTGFDAAYTAKKTADYSVLLGGRNYGGDIYLTFCTREQVEPEDLETMFKEAGVTEIHFDHHPVEKGLIETIRKFGVTVHAEVAVSDKRARATGVAALWNQARVFVPRDADWVQDFLEELYAFTGSGDANDDQVDAFSSLYRALMGGVQFFGPLSTEDLSDDDLEGWGVGA